MLDIETVALPVSQHRGVNLHVLQQTCFVIVAHGVHERALARHTVVIQFIRNQRCFSRTTIYRHFENLIFTIADRFIELNSVIRQKITSAGSPPHKGTRILFKQ